ncbi:MAG: hypothetical protein N2V75_09665 [Methanophagales archaeon]|nr:hypothetical protein [Methanophagales archaeon]
MGNLFLIRGEGHNDFIPLFTTALNSKPETVIRKYKERFSIEITLGQKRASSVWFIISFNACTRNCPI